MWSAVLRRSCVWPRIDEIAAWSIGGSTSTSTESRNEHRMKRVVRPGIFFWIFVAALAPLDEGRGDNCFERCASALGGQDAVSASIYDNCLNSCRAGASLQESVRFAALAMSLATLRSGSSHGQNSESDAQQLALKNCATVASDCKLVNWGYNLCFALTSFTARLRTASSLMRARFRPAPGAGRCERRMGIPMKEPTFFSPLTH